MQFDPNAAVSNVVKGKFVASLEVTEATSKAGNPMFKVWATLNVNGRERKSVDYIGSWNLYKLKELAEVCGLSDKFSTGSMEAIDLDGQVVGVQVAPDKDDEDRIAIKHYVPASDVRESAYQAPAATAAGPSGGPEIDDDIPF